MLILEDSNRVTFDVNVQGTATKPVVRCVIGDSPAISFPAKSISEGKFEAMIDVPKSLGAGSHPFKIEVLLNGRLFTPINTQITVESKQPVSTPEFKETPKAAKEAVKESMPKAKAPATLSRLESTVKQPVQKLKPRKEAAAPVVETKIRMADITNEAVDRKAPATQAKSVKVLEQASSVPLTLIKGSIIYR